MSVYTFLPWTRSGIAAAIDVPDDLQGIPARTPLVVQLKATEERDVLDSASRQVEREVVGAETIAFGAGDLRLHGPGDVTGIDTREVTRMEPRPGTRNAEPNYFPAMEFERHDFPWLFTPARADASQRLRPWLVLVAVRRDRAALSTDPDLPLTVLRADPRAELPSLAESQFWAHVQVAGSLAGGSLARILAEHPERVTSRILCPRRLEPDTAYYACLVPAFESGRLAGLGATPPEDEDPDAVLEPAWSVGGDAPAAVELPVYHHWEFRTGAAGDFESLARLLSARRAPGGIGQRPMDIGRPGFGYDRDAAGDWNPVLGLEGALQGPETKPTEWPEAARAPFQDALRAILNAPAERTAATSGDGAPPGDDATDADPVVAPPIYGRWHAAAATVPAEGEPPLWLGRLNRDPRHRAVAGFGTRVVQKHQEQLMASAWRQVQDVEAANALLRQAQLGREASRVIHARTLASLSVDALLAVTAPLHARVTLSPETLRKRLAGSRIPRAVLSPAFRRLARPQGPLARRLFGTVRHGVRPLVRRLNRGEIAAAPPRRPPDGTVLMDRVADAFWPAWAPGCLRRILPDLHRLLLRLALLVLLLAGLAAVLGASTLPSFLAGLGLVLTALARPFRTRAGRWRGARDGRMERFTPQHVAGLPGRPRFDVAAPGEEPKDGAFSRESGPDSEAAARFRAAAVAHQAVRFRERALPEPKTPPALDLEALRRTLLERLDPEFTFPRHVLARVRIPGHLPRPEDPLDPILAAPEFPQPMYRPLAELGEQLFLPGVAKIKPNTITALETNPRFVEAYMVGLNHEMARELLWRNYPTDQRGTYFARFWDAAGGAPGNGDGTDAGPGGDRMLPIHAWPSGKDLGQAGDPAGDRDLVLLIRGELLRRYPTAMVYAVRAVWEEHDGRKRRRPDPEAEAAGAGAADTGSTGDTGARVRHPRFLGRLDPDITFLGFRLTGKEARGSRDPDGDPGWFFVLQEQPTEPRFGLAAARSAPGDPASWRELSWEHVTAGTADGAGAPTHLPITSTPFGTDAAEAGSPVAWGAHAAAMAHITLQTPVRLAIHADGLLPPDAGAS